MNELLSLVDALAATLGRPIGVDDRRFKSLAYSAHVEGVDQVRLASILQREAPAEAQAWLESLGVQEVRDYLRVPANPRLGMAERICFPVRFERTLLGYLWLINEPEPLTEQEMQTARLAADEMGIAIYKSQHLDRAGQEQEHELLRALVNGPPDAARQAAEQLVDGGFLATVPSYGVIVVRAAGAIERQVPDSVRIRLAAAVEQLRRSVAPRHLLVLVTGEQVTGVLAVDRSRTAEASGCAVVDYACCHLADTPDWTPIVGLAEPGPLEALRTAYEQARMAAWVGTRIPSCRPLACWESLGAYRTLAALITSASTPPRVPRALQQLAAAPEGERLIMTLESYLEHGADARATAAALFLHRSSLYGRLRRIETAAGVDLSSGDDRLELHLGIRLRRLGYT